MQFPVTTFTQKKIKYEDYKAIEEMNPPPKLERPFKKWEGVLLDDNIKEIFESSFIMLILGRPGSGKSSLLSQLIIRPEFYGKKFGRILYITPSEIPGIQHDKINTCKTMDFEWISQQMKIYQNTCRNILLVIDDVISDIPSGQKSAIKNLFYDRRHVLGPNSCLSIIITSQKYTCIPKWLRVVADMFISFGVQPAELRLIHDELNTGKDIKTLGHIYKSMEKHDFVYFNLQQGKINLMVNETSIILAALLSGKEENVTLQVLFLIGLFTAVILIARQGFIIEKAYNEDKEREKKRA